MKYNLDVYWPRRGRARHLLLFDAWVDFAVTTLPRILHTVRTGEVISKADALARVAQDERWHELGEEVHTRRTGDRPVSLVPRPLRLSRVVRFIQVYRDGGLACLASQSRAD